MSSPSQFVGSTTANFIAKVTRPRGGTRSTLILFQSRSGSGSTRGSMAMNSPQAKASRRRTLRRSWTFQFKVGLVRTPMRAPMSAPFPRTPTHLRADDLVSVEPNRLRAQEHRSENRSWQTAIAAKCSSARIDRRTVVVAPWKTSKIIKHSKRLSSRRDAVEHELVLRLASLFWRMPPATPIHPYLFHIQ